MRRLAVHCRPGAGGAPLSGEIAAGCAGRISAQWRCFLALSEVDKTAEKVIDYYHENDHHDVDRKAPDRVPPGLVPARGTRARRSIECVRFGGGRIADPPRQSAGQTGD